MSVMKARADHDGVAGEIQELLSTRDWSSSAEATQAAALEGTTATKSAMDADARHAQVQADRLSSGLHTARAHDSLLSGCGRVAGAVPATPAHVCRSHRPTV